MEKAEGFESSSGIGVRGGVGGRRFALGNSVLMEQEGVDASPSRRRLKNCGTTEQVSYTSLPDGRLLGLLAVADPIKAKPPALAVLRQAGLGE